MERVLRNPKRKQARSRALGIEQLGERLPLTVQIIGFDNDLDGFTGVPGRTDGSAAVVSNDALSGVNPRSGLRFLRLRLYDTSNRASTDKHAHSISRTFATRPGDSWDVYGALYNPNRDTGFYGAVSVKNTAGTLGDNIFYYTTDQRGWTRDEGPYIVTYSGDSVVDIRIVETAISKNDKRLFIDDLSWDRPNNAITDYFGAYEKWGNANELGGQNGGGNVLINDSYYKAGDQVIGVAPGVVSGANGNLGIQLVGSFGWMYMLANGDFTYTIDDSNPTVQALGLQGQNLTDVFSYRSMDTEGFLHETQVYMYIYPGNDFPVMNALSNLTIAEDAGLTTVGLSGILAGGGESQNLSVSVSSNNLALIPTPSVFYTSANTTGSISFTPVQNAFGSAVITVTVNDGGVDNDFNTADNGWFTQVFTVTVTPSNDAPTLDALANLTIAEDAPLRTVNLTGIAAGGGESQPLVVTATSNNASLIPNPTINYTSANATGSLTFTPIADQQGTAVITVTVTDGGLDNNLTTTADNGSLSRLFTVTVTPTNDAPTLAAIANLTIAEDAPLQTVNLTGIAAGGGESQPLVVTATSNNASLIPNPTINYTSANATGTLTFTPIADQQGTAVITVTVTDGGLDNNLTTTADNGSLSRLFTVTVTPTNDAPTLAAIANLTIAEDVPLQTVNLTGIAAGGGESQPLVITSTSNNASLIPNPTINYTSANATGTLTFTPIANRNGTAVVTVTVTDGGLDNNLTTTADNGSLSRLFTVTVTPTNDVPTLAAIANLTIAEDAPLQTVNLTGIAAGSGESQPLAITATSDNSSLIPNPTINYTSANATGTLTFTPIANRNGTAVVTVTVTDGGLDNNLTTTADNGSLSQLFTVTVTPSNDAPTLAAIPSRTIAEDAPLQTVNLTGISSGGGESQPLTITASSNNTSLIPNPTVNYTSPNATGSLNFTPIANQHGAAVIAVTVIDGGLDNNLATTADNRSLSRFFTVTVTPSNDAPTLAAIANITIDEDATLQSVNLTGISAGGGETQSLAISATSNNTSLVPHPTITYTSPNATGTLVFTTIPNQHGTAVITVTVTDGGPDNDLSTVADNATVTRFFTVTVNSANDPPTIDPITDRIVLKNAPLQTVILSGITSGPSESQPLNISASVSPEGILGNLRVNYTSGTAGSLEFTPLPGIVGVAEVLLTVEDAGDDNRLDTRSDNSIKLERFKVTVDAPPVAVDDSHKVLFDIPKAIAVLANDFDPDGTVDPATVRIATPPSTGSVKVLADGSIEYTADPNFRGTTEFSYTVRDNLGVISSPARVGIRVVTSYYQNYKFQLDVDDDTTISPLDVLTLVNDINGKGSRTVLVEVYDPPPFIDVNGDRRIDPLDVLLVINYINSRSANGEGEKTFDFQLEPNSDASEFTAHLTDQSLAVLQIVEELERKQRPKIRKTAWAP